MEFVSNAQDCRFEERDLQYVKKAMSTPILHLKVRFWRRPEFIILIITLNCAFQSAGVHPTIDIVEMFSAQMPEVPFSEVLVSEFEIDIVSDCVAY